MPPRLGPFLWALFALAAAVAEAARPSYTVIAPNTVRPNTEYHVAVSAHGIGEDQQQDVRLVIRGVTDDGKTIEIREDTTVRADSTQVVRIVIGALGAGHYTLTASGNSPITFDQTQELTYVHKGYSFFVQTDKAIYRPGNTVHFRAVIVSPELKPIVARRIGVTVSDAQGNVIRRWPRAFTTKGVFAGDLQLAGAPVMGDWNVTVEAEGQHYNKSFLVAEYVLPKFAVNVELPPFATFSQGDMKVKITATYGYGGPVNGEATVSVFPKYKSSYLQPFFAEPVRRVLPINGTLEFSMNVARELDLSDDYAREVVFDVHVSQAGFDSPSRSNVLLYIGGRSKDGEDTEPDVVGDLPQVPLQTRAR